MSKSTLEWKQTISQRLIARNKHEIHEYIDLIDSQSKLAEQVSSLKSRNSQLTVDNEILRGENLSLHLKVESGTGGGIGTQQLEQKLYKLQEELTELHRKRGENAQQIIDLSNAMKERDKELQTKESQVVDHIANENSLKRKIKALEHTVMELEATNQTIKDEHQALQMAFAALEERYKKLQEQNDELMARWLHLKMQEAEKMNKENDLFFAQRQEKMRKDLAEAAKEQVLIQPEEFMGVKLKGITPMCLKASLPDKVYSKFDAHDGEVNAIMWSPTGNLFASGGSDRKIKLWDHNGGQCNCRGTLLGSNAGITSLEFDMEESLLLAASNDYASRLWSLSDQRLRHTLTGHSGKVLSAKFLADSSKVVTGSHDRTLKIWDLITKACSKTIFAGSSCNDLVTLHGTHIISGHFDKRIRFWDSRSDNTSNEIGLHGRITSLALSPDGSALLACTREDTIKVIDLRMNQILQTLSNEHFKVAQDWTRAVYSPDGDYTAAGSSDGTLFIWNIKTGKVERTLKEHSHAVIACSWHPVGSYIVSSEKQKKVVMWSD